MKACRLTPLSDAVIGGLSLAALFRATTDGLRSRISVMTEPEKEVVAISKLELQGLCSVLEALCFVIIVHYYALYLVKAPLLLYSETPAQYLDLFYPCNALLHHILVFTHLTFLLRTHLFESLQRSDPLNSPTFVDESQGTPPYGARDIRISHWHPVLLKKIRYTKNT